MNQAFITRAIRGRKLTSKDVARVLGVSEATVKRWADDGRLPMLKTAGGHRRFRPEDIAVFKRSGFGGESPPPGRTTAGRRLAAARSAGEHGETTETRLGTDAEEQLIEEIFRVLLEGRAEELSALLVNLYLHGQTVAKIADRFISVVMRRIGDLWHRGELSIAQEHVATRTVTSALHNLRNALHAPVETRRSALCCSVEEDFHDLPLQLAALTLEAGGVEVFNMGTNTPFFSLTEALEWFHPDLVCVSATILTSMDRAAREYAEFHQTARRAGASIVLGGAGFANGEVRRRLPADLYADSFQQLEEFIRDFTTTGR